MALKSIPDHPFSDDDGTADPRLAAALSAYAADRAAESQVLAALPGARLLVPVVAVLTEAETGPDGMRRDKKSEMAVPTYLGPDGRRALPAFTSTESLIRWRADARPVAVPFGQVLRAAAHEKADTVVFDMAGPVTYELSGPALYALADGRDRLDPLTDPVVAAAVREAVAGEQGVERAYLLAAQDGQEADGNVCLVPAASADLPATARRVATALAADETLRTRLVRGLDLALLAPGARVPGEPLFSRG